MKDKLNILVINRNLNQNETATQHIFPIYGELYDLMLFPPKELGTELLIQFVFYKYSLITNLENIFHKSIQYDGNDAADFFDMDITEIELNVFYDMLNQEFEVNVTELTTIESVTKKIKSRKLISAGNFCPDCGGLCGNSNHDRRW